MDKIISVVLVALGLLIVQTNSMSFVNNVTVPSDILTTVFFNEIKNNPSLFDIPVENTAEYNTTNCVMALQEIVNQFPSSNVLPFVDSWGSLPSGVLYGHLKDLGNFDQCVRTSVNLSQTIGTVKGQYCFAAFPLTQQITQEVPEEIGFDPQVRAITKTDLVSLSIAICVPDTCDPKVVESVFKNASESIFQGAFSGIKINRCITNQKPELKAINIVGIVIFSIIAALMVFSTAYDVYTEYLKKPVMPLLLAFSVLTNGRKLFAINITKSPNSIDCLTGIRVLSMMWVVYCHNYVFSALLPHLNLIDLLTWSKAASSMHVLSASVSVDTFLFISGLLIAWLGFRELDKSKGKLNVLMMYFHRYIRLTPAVAAVILFYVSIMQYVGTGPLRQIYFDLLSGCENHWWTTLLYIQNYATVQENTMCIAQSWYLGVDTQLYILSPLILIPLWKWGRKFTPVMVILSLLSIGCVIATYFTEGYNKFLDTVGKNQFRLTYTPTHTRYSVWLVGVGLGYFMYKNRNKSMRPSKLVQVLGWFVCFATILTIIYGPYFTIRTGREKTVFETAMYESLKRVSWSIALSWLVFACHFGFGGIINSMLSHPWWQPLGRLTFSMYLVHMAVQSINFGITRTDVYFSNYQQILLFWSTFGVSVMAAIVLTLAFESPILVIEKTLLGGSKKSKPPAIQEQDTCINITKNESIESAQKSA